MLAYSVLMFAIAALYIGLAAAIYRGNTKLIHASHQAHVKEADKGEYGKSFSKGLFVLAASLVFSGIIALWGTAIPVVLISVGVLLVGIGMSLIVLAKVQKEYNGGF